MERRERGREATRLWYAVTFLVGIYWSISLLSESFNFLFICWGPLIICVGAALRLVGRIGARILYEALNLFAMFGIGVGVGGGLQIVGAVEFFRNRLTLFQMLLQFLVLRLLDN